MCRRSQTGGIAKEKITEFRKFMRENNIYEFSNVAPSSKEVLMQMMLEGYDVYPTSKYYSDIDKIIIPLIKPTIMVILIFTVMPNSLSSSVKSS